ncbi:MAG: hypothetical protein JXX29_10445 [Deltaproteobacteria bacterium]|nr:hypothetical protein [Deltaproteobacteria bacterium]MBN2672086.1 hypothetical protein [Deltaproteobacteria bacterium]
MTSSRTNLTSEAQSILDFENALNDWTTPNTNSALDTSYNATSGVYSLAVTPNGWTEIYSPVLSTLGTMKPTVSLDVFVPEPLYWGELRIVVQVPSKGIWWSELGSHTLSELNPGQFAHVEFTFPPETLAALESEYDDARLIVIINAPQLSAPYLLDNIVLTNDTISDPDPIPTEGEVIEFSLRGPRIAPIASIALNSHTTMKLGANVQVESPELENSIVSSLGDTPFRMVEPDATLGTLISGGNADIGDRVHLNGSLVAPSYTLGQGAVVDGDTVTEAILEPQTVIPFKIEFPNTITETVWLEPLQTATIVPGGYGMVRVGPNATLALESGKYYIDTLNVEDSASVETLPKIVLKQNSGPVIVYVKEIVGFHGNVVSQTGETPNWLLVYTGQQDLHLDRDFNGTVVAPNALLSLHACTHAGAFYANAINVEANAHIVHQVGNVLLTGGTIDIQECSDQIVGPENLDEKQNNIEFQKLLIEYCIAPDVDIDSCYLALVARAQVDRTTAALQFVNEEISASQYLGVARHRTEMLRRARHDEEFASFLCYGSDSDEDWVIDSNDNCPETASLMPVNDVGCVTELPTTPDDSVLRDGLEHFNVTANTACDDAPVPGMSAPGGFFKRSNPARVFLVMSEAADQPHGCAVFYQFEIQGETYDGQPAHLILTFRESEKTADLVDLGRPVPYGLVQFIATNEDSGDRGKLATDLKPYHGAFRVRAYNAAGHKGMWSQWKKMTQKDCLSLGFRCANAE